MHPEGYPRNNGEIAERLQVVGNAFGQYLTSSVSTALACAKK
jgi:hypothetical protein